MPEVWWTGMSIRQTGKTNDKSSVREGGVMCQGTEKQGKEGEEVRGHVLAFE